MMRKIYLSMLLFMLCVVYAVANPVTQAQALQKAKAFLQKRGTATTANLNLVYQGRQVSPQHGAPAKDPCYYVFNNGHNAGFIIMAGDDCAEDVLGYADSGTFDPNDIPDNMQEFLKGYVEEIVAARARNANSNTYNTDPDVEVELTRKVVAPLIQTHWNQQDPYNQQCFTSGGQQAVTGCVATAFAQVMYYHKWPQGSTEEVPAYSSYEALPSTTFDWNKMKPVYINTGEDNEDAEAAVAKLMLYCGHAVRMNYGTGASSASPSRIPNALKNYFGYPNDPQYVSRDYYTTEEWDELIYTELKYGRPVLYGASTSGEAGHQFICDGYDGHGLYHINWGWGGISDGYFRLQALRPSSQSTGGSGDNGGYSLGQDAIIGVSSTEIINQETPQQGTEEEEAPLLTYALEVTSATTINYDSSTGFSDITIHFAFTLSNDPCNFDLGFGLYQNGQPKKLMNLMSNYTLGTGQIGSFTNKYLFNLGNNLSDGTYQIVGISRVNGTSNWLPNVDSEYKYIEVVISNGQATFTNVSLDPPSPAQSLTVTKIEQRFDEGTDLTQIRAYFTNNGEKDCSSSVYLLINNTWVAQEGVYIPKGGNDYVDFFFTKTTGNVTAVVATDEQGSHPLYTGNISLSGSAPSQPTLTLKNVNIKNLGNGKIYGSMLDGTATFENSTGKDFEGNLTLKVNVVTKQEGGYIYFTPKTQSIPVSIKASETKTVPFSFTRMTVGDKIRYYLYDPAGNEIATSSWIDVVPAIALWKGTGDRTAVEPTSYFTIPEDVCAVSLEDLGNNLGSYHITLNDNPNTIYYVTGSAIGFDNPDAMIVRGGMAENVELDANYDFYFPMSFHANSILYSWIPDKNMGADGKNGWQTITLPFGVQAVTSVGNPIDWYRGNETEDNKDFWVREFKQVEGNVVKFADANEWVANVPYIIAIPGNHWGPQYDLTNKEMQFIAEDVLVERTTVSAVVSDGYEFVGVTGGLNPLNGAEELAMSEKFGDVYILNERGNAFVPASVAQMTGKHNMAYFTINDRTIDPPSYLNIGTFDNADGISTPRIATAEGQQVDVYAIDGVKVSIVTINNGTIDLSHLPKGVYIVEGKKVVRK